MSRKTYDAASQDTRRAFRDYYIQQQDIEAHNQFVDEALRRKRITAAQKLVDSLNTTLRATVHGSCA